MKIYHLIILFSSIQLLGSTKYESNENFGYINYHELIIEAEGLISEEKFSEALMKYDKIFRSYDFIFLRDYKIVSQLALYIGEEEKALYYIKKGITSGWTLKALNANKFLKPLQIKPEWKALEKDYDSLHNQNLARIDLSAKEKVHAMFKKDQKKALGALLRIGDKAQERYALKKFAPHSENQIKELIKLLENQGYPGERLIGNNYWMSTIVSHHNSITQEYVKNDTLYKFIRPLLIQAINKGQISPYEFALIDDWQKAVSFNRASAGYGFLNPPSQSTLSKTNDLRLAIGLRPVELRNKLIDVENKTGLNLYLPDWVKGKIIIEQK